MPILKLSPEEKLAIKELYEQGMKVSQVVSRFNNKITGTYVRKMARENKWINSSTQWLVDKPQIKTQIIKTPKIKQDKPKPIKNKKKESIPEDIEIKEEAIKIDEQINNGMNEEDNAEHLQECLEAVKSFNSKEAHAFSLTEMHKVRERITEACSLMGDTLLDALRNIKDGKIQSSQTIKKEVLDENGSSRVEITRYDGITLKDIIAGFKLFGFDLEAPVKIAIQQNFNNIQNPQQNTDITDIEKNAIDAFENDKRIKLINVVE